MKNEIIILIPAYNPDEKLIKVLNDLEKNKYSEIVVINDGSVNNKIWEKISKKVKIIKHDKNQGKGRALKTGIDYCLKSYKNKVGIITLDADGQHLVEDVNKLYATLIKNNESVVLGSRNFYDKNIPFTSRMGNIIFRNIFKLKTKKAITDTQTGLRAFPWFYLDNLLKVEGERFDYETNVLIDCVERKIPIIEVSIETLYINKNESSHFNKIKDTINVCKTITKK